MKRIAIIAYVVLVASLYLSIASAQTRAVSAREYRQAHESEIIAEFVDLLSVPNVASDTVNIRRNADKLIGLMTRRGIAARLLEGNGPPAIFGELKTPGATH